MKYYLLIDFGSTYTKLTAVDIEKEEIAATSKAITTVDSGIMDGYLEAMEGIYEKIGRQATFVKKLACSSAAGGLKMVAIGLVPDLTAEAAKRAALGAGARVIKTYSFNLSSDEINEIKEIKPDIILLAGGTDGGNKDTIIFNAKMLAASDIRKPVIVAGNKSARDAVREVFNESGMEYYVCDNVMPRLNVLEVDPAREEIRKVFMSRIIEAKGMGDAMDLINGILMPTPQSVLKAAEILSTGSDKEEGAGDLIVVDIGGATTDVHSLCDGEPTKTGVTFRGLEEPFSKRTVEGDLGMRYSAISLFEASSTREIKRYLKNKDQD
ncbi:MAG: methylaspartate mutase accessory protein GlmL, partial [Clostridiaceae bacterium]